MNPFLSSILSRNLIDRSQRHRRNVLAKYRELLDVSGRTPDQIRTHQNRKLTGLLRHAALQVPRWQSQLPAPDEITEDHAQALLRRLAIMDRAAIQADPQSFVARDAQHTVEDATGGSTGTPLVFLVDRETQVAREASLYWANHLAGWRYGERVAMLWGSDRDVGNAKADPKLELRWHLDNMRWYNAFDMGEDRMEAFHAGMTRFRPHVIVAYAGSLWTYAQFLQQRNLRPAYPLKALISSAEMLTDEMRQLIEQVFQRPIFNRYGNRESGAIAAEDLLHDGFLVNEADFLVEIDSPNPCEQPGPILVTYFANRAMPFIRYNTGDLGVWRVLPGDVGPRRIGRIAGRQGDTIRTRGGKLIHGEYFTHILYGHSDVMQFQFIQETLDHYRLLVVLRGARDPEREARWQNQILDHIGREAKLTVEVVDVIPPLPSGKHKFTLSLLQSA